MILQLEHQNIETATSIRNLFQVSYKIEAALLQAEDFPPLKRPLSNFTDAPTTFFGYFDEKELAAAVELKISESQVHIQSLVVDPTYFRKGIASRLMDFVLNSFTTKEFMVETGADNHPAIALYEKFGFSVIKQWNTPFNIQKVRLVKKIR